MSRQLSVVCRAYRRLSVAVGAGQGTCREGDIESLGGGVERLWLSGGDTCSRCTQSPAFRSVVFCRGNDQGPPAVPFRHQLPANIDVTETRGYRPDFLSAVLVRSRDGIALAPVQPGSVWRVVCIMVCCGTGDRSASASQSFRGGCLRQGAGLFCVCCLGLCVFFLVVAASGFVWAHRGWVRAGGSGGVMGVQSGAGKRGAEVQAGVLARVGTGYVCIEGVRSSLTRRRKSDLSTAQGC